MSNIFIMLDQTPLEIVGENLNNKQLIENYFKKVKEYISNISELEKIKNQKIIICDPDLEEDYDDQSQPVKLETQININSDFIHLQIENRIIFFENEKESFFIYNDYKKNQYDTKIFVKNKTNEDIFIIKHATTYDNKDTYEIIKNFQESYYVYNEKDKYFSHNQRQSWSIEKNNIELTNETRRNANYNNLLQYVLSDTLNVKNDDLKIIKKIKGQIVENEKFYFIELQNCPFKNITLSDNFDFIKAEISSTVLKTLSNSKVLSLNSLEFQKINEEFKLVNKNAQNINSFDNILKTLQNCHDLESLIEDNKNKNIFINLKDLNSYLKKSLPNHIPELLNIDLNFKNNLEKTQLILKKPSYIQEEFSNSGIYFHSFVTHWDYKKDSILEYSNKIYNMIENHINLHFEKVGKPVNNNHVKLKRPDNNYF